MKNEEDLSTEVESLINTLKKVVDKEITFIKGAENDWSLIKDFQSRDSTHNLHKLLTKRNVDYCKALFTLATKNGDIDKKPVIAMLNKLSEFFEIYEKRFDFYVSKSDFSKMMSEMKDSKKSKDIKDELEFQSDITKNVAEMRNIMTQISRLQDKTKVVISVYNDIPLPFFMQENIERIFPEVKIAFEERIKKEKTENENHKRN